MNIYSIRHIPYTNKHNRRQNIIDQNRAKSSQGTRQHSTSNYRCTTQQTNNLTPNNMQIFEIQPYVGQLIKNQQQQFVSTQFEKKFILSSQKLSSSRNSKQCDIIIKLKLIVIQVNDSINKSNEKIERINRINYLGDLLEQMNVTELEMVPKNKVELFNIQTQQEQNIEEIHFYLVESQQRIKQHTQVIEQQKYLS